MCMEVIRISKLHLKVTFLATVCLASMKCHPNHCLHHVLYVRQVPRLQSRGSYSGSPSWDLRSWRWTAWNWPQNSVSRWVGCHDGSLVQRPPPGDAHCTTWSFGKQDQSLHRQVQYSLPSSETSVYALHRAWNLKWRKPPPCFEFSHTDFRTFCSISGRLYAWYTQLEGVWSSYACAYQNMRSISYKPIYSACWLPWPIVGSNFGCIWFSAFQCHKSRDLPIELLFFAWWPASQASDPATILLLSPWGEADMQDISQKERLEQQTSQRKQGKTLPLTCTLRAEARFLTISRFPL